MSDQDIDGVNEDAGRALENTAETRANRPRVALMGEFSAGKSTLSNLLLGKAALPVNVTATQLPPVWISFGDQPPFSVGIDGAESDVDESFSGVSVHETRYVRLFHQSKFLTNCDLIDMPGISDPNMDAEVWKRVIGEADIVIWCSHATQAWRQSEAAVWSMMPQDLYQKSLLLLTRMDRILSDRDRARVVKRVQGETNGLFGQVIPVSLVGRWDGASRAWPASPRPWHNAASTMPSANAWSKSRQRSSCRPGCARVRSSAGLRSGADTISGLSMA